MSVNAEQAARVLLRYTGVPQNMYAWLNAVVQNCISNLPVFLCPSAPCSERDATPAD
jgi:hypothetical protein